METSMNKLVEAKAQEMLRQRQSLVKGWNKYISAIEEHVKSKSGRSLTDIEKVNIAQCLENATMNAVYGQKGRLFEATTEDSIAFLGIQLPVIAALLPSLILNDIASVQALDRRMGAVFYLNVAYGTDKGSISNGDTMLNALTGHARDNVAQRLYPSTLVRGENTTITSGTGTYNVAYRPGVDVTTSRRYSPEKAIVLKDASGTVVASDNNVFSGYATEHAGTLMTAAAASVGTITAAGLLTLSGATADSAGLTIDYCYQYDLPVNATTGERTGVPEANISMAQSEVTALDFPIKSKYSIGAAIDVQKAHGISLENELTKFLGGEIRFTMDHFGIDLIDQVACSQMTVPNPFSTTTNLTPATAVTAWNAGITSGQEWVWKKNELNDRFEEGNVNIISKTLRAMATFIIAGNNVARVIKQLPNFKSASTGKTPPTGPYKLGTLDDRAVYHDPFLSDYTIDGSTVTGPNRYLMGYKGDSFLMAGFAFCPYIPLMTTPTLVTADLFAQKGFLSAGGFKILNPGMYTYGTIANLGTNVANYS
jgi:hypothetical protein